MKHWNKYMAAFCISIGAILALREVSNGSDVGFTFIGLLFSVDWKYVFSAFDV